MDAHGINLLPARRAAVWPRVDALALARLLSTVASTLLSLVGLAGILVCTRRLGGALTEPLAPGVLVALGAGLALAAALFRLATFAESAAGRRTSGMRWAGPSLVLALWCAGVATGQPLSVGLLAFLGILIAEESLSWGYWRKVTSRLLANLNRSSSPPVREPVTSLLLDDEPDEPGAGDALEPGVLARWVRSRHQDGSETIEGAVRVLFQAGERQTQAHLAICPPLAVVPQCFAEPTDGADAQVRVAQVLAYGVRLEVKLDEPAEEACDVTIGFTIAERAESEAGDEAG